MRILFHVFIPSSPRAAGIQQSIRVAYYLAKKGARVSVHAGAWYFKDKRELLDFFGFDDLPDFQVHFYPNPLKCFKNEKLVFGWGFVFHLYRFLKLLLSREKSDYDVFFARGHRFPALHVFFKPVLKYRVVFEFHEILYLDKAPEEQIYTKRKRLDFEQYSYKKADGVIAISHALKELAERKWGRARRITVIPSGGVLFESRPLPLDRPLSRIYFVGNYYPLSGLEYAVQAMPHIPRASLTVVGGGEGSADHERIKKLVDGLNLDGRVTFLGFIEPNRLPEVYAQADILVMPVASFVRSKYFISPLKLFEYMSARRPIVASDLPTIREILCDRQNALLAPSEDPEGIAKAVLTLMEDPALAFNIAEQAYRDVQRYSMDNKCDAILSFLEEMAA